MRHLAPAALLLALAGCRAATSPPQPEPSLPEEQEALLPEHLAALPRTLLDLHNRERAEVGAAPLAWDASLAAAAAAYGPALAARTGLAHSPAKARRGQGENLWMGTRNRYSIESMFDGWAREQRLFRPGAFPAVSRTGKWSDVAHYTQIIWAGTSRLGCAVHRTPDWDYLICRYSPAGNVIGLRVP
jgi:hypothetical protein